MTIYRSLLERGYFPKELPPSFHTSQFAAYASSRRGRALLEHFRPADNFTECVAFELAMPGGERRHLQIPHPGSYSKLARLVAKSFRRLLKLCHRSRFSSSRPTYSPNQARAILPDVRPQNLARHRALTRAGSSVLLKVDVSQFYPSLYTHAIGWSIDPKLRQRQHWSNHRLLGKKVDQALMDLQRKVSQGVPTGNDVSFLLGELVLAQIDRAIRAPKGRAFRWYDDWEFGCETRHEAEVLLANISRGLASIGLRLNPLKTEILSLPLPAEDGWRDALLAAADKPLASEREVVRFFDTAFRLHRDWPKAPTLLYALGVLFKERAPRAAEVAQACVTQAILSEPGCAQKAFALLTYWALNGTGLDIGLLTKTVERVIVQHEARGLSSDIAWALGFCLDHHIRLGRKSGAILSRLDDDCTALQALHMSHVGLLPHGFNHRRMTRALATASLDGPHWLLAYESVRHGFLGASAPAVTAHQLFSDLLQTGVTFYRVNLPKYAMVLHPGGAPEWIVRGWLRDVMAGRVQIEGGESTLRAIAEDYGLLGPFHGTEDDAVVELMGVRERAGVEELMALIEPYGRGRR